MQRPVRGEQRRYRNPFALLKTSRSRAPSRRTLGRVAVVLALCAGSFVAGTVEDEPAPAEAATIDEYPWKNAIAHRPSKYEWWIDENKDGRKQITDHIDSDNDESVDPNGYFYRNCNSYVAWRVNKEFGVNAADLGNGGQWDNNARGRYAVDKTPEPGDAAVWDPVRRGDAFGHVAFVESVNSDGTVNISEYNWGSPNGLPGTRRSMKAHHYIDFNGPGNEREPVRLAPPGLGDLVGHIAVRG